jgi:DNA-binding NtrC family response regulator
MADPSLRVLIVDDDAMVAESIANCLADVGYDTTFTISAEHALDLLADAERGGGLQPTGNGEGALHDRDGGARPYSVLIADMATPGMGGLELIKFVRQHHPYVASIMIAGYGTIETAVKAIRNGALDYLTKPIVDQELRSAVERAIRQQTLLTEGAGHRRQADQSWRGGLGNIIGSDARMVRIYDIIEAVAASKTTVLMCGESGTGKSLIARAIHRHSPRAERPFVEVSCGSIPEMLLESELFGHVKGAFTGAHANKIGRFLAAHTGTLFLDEINSASPAMQLKLLRVLQERTFEPVGSNEPVEVDVRIILASNQPLEQLVAAGQFRHDLYYRINVVTINLPPLRDRKSDIPLLAEHIREEKARDAGKQVVAFTAQAMDALKAYSYPGNVRELENIVERAVVLTKGTRIAIDDLPEHVMQAGSVGSGATASCSPPLANAQNARQEGLAFAKHHKWEPSAAVVPLHMALQEPEKQIILAALRANDWNRQKTAQQLDINRTTLYKKIKQYRLEDFAESSGQ